MKSANLTAGLCVRIAFSAIWLAAAPVLHSAPSGAELTYVDLVRRLTDLESLATLPQPGEKTAQFSSYDRNSTDPNVLTEKNWFANGDRGQYLRKEKGEKSAEFVLMDADGPGAIVRFWSANANEGGIVRIPTRVSRRRNSSAIPGSATMSQGDITRSPRSSGKNKLQSARPCGRKTNLSAHR